MHLITAKQTADILGLRLPRLHELTRMRVVPFVRIGKKQLRFDPEVLAEWTRQGGVEKPNPGNPGEVNRDAARSGCPRLINGANGNHPGPLTVNPAHGGVPVVVLNELGRPVGGHSVRTLTFETGDPGGGQLGLSDQAGIWEIRLNDGSTYSLPLTFEEMYDAGDQNSPKLKAAIRRAID